ncbi:hypothetical protein CGK23_22785 [Vibrio parahaemolyticus]|uniref:hypothetical protein n=1 Tax=Vibrio parahaemolyticus TaxID=670 RepID=UPI001120FEFF|nr:hypothetical protein [Vibrio parahaemolyticus]TOA55137.1 hypothetical protein CGK23_22785 [Vibrio parahaemolyticus]
MKKTGLIILLVLIAVPLLFPLFFKAYIAYVPGEMVGNEDGWLGFLGGYTGGLLAFISAYFIYRNEKLVRERTLLHISNGKDDSGEAPISVLTPRRIDQADPALARITLLPFIEVTFEVMNVSDNFANDVQLKLLGRSGAILWFYHVELEQYIEYESIALLQASQSRIFKMKIDNHLVANHEVLDFELSSTNLFGQITKQNVQLLLHKEAKGYLFKHRT